MDDVRDVNGNPTGRKELIVSHGVDYETLKNVVLPQEHPRVLGAHYNTTINGWVLRD
jgi:hypothetical protein